MVKVTIDGKEVEVPAGELIIKAAQDNGTYIPRFCWHPRMEPVGMCRMCLVEVETPRGKGLVTSCTQRCAEGTIVDTKSDVVKKAQEGVLEFLLLNHPLDCPVCDRGGECPLQDQTISHGPGESRFVEEKRHFEKPIPISDLVMLDRERCILCARCTRFSDEISGDPLIEFIDRGNHTQVNTFPDEPFASYFSGNTVQICPVGALTATPYRFRARPWDLEAVESTCTMCAVGCRVSVQSSQNEVLRVLGVDSEPVSHGWLCDKGRFGYEYLRSAARVATPLVRGDDGELLEASWGDALAAAADGISRVIEQHGPTAVAGIGGARSTNEEAYAFGKLLRSVIGTGNLDARVGDALAAGLLAAGSASIGDLERAKTILVWGPDLKEELPVLYLRVRRAATALGATLIVVHPRGTGLDPDADHVVRYRPGEGGATLERLAAGDGDLAPVREAIEGPTVAIVGRTGVTDSPELAAAVAAFVTGLPDAGVLTVARRGNLIGALDMGMAPDRLPGRVANDAAGRTALAEVWGTPVPEPGSDADGIIAGLADGAVKALLLLGADPAADHPDRARAMPAIAGAEFTVSLDLFVTDSNRAADVILPVEGFTEVEGTVTNVEGRVQKVNRITPGAGQSRQASEVIADLAERLGGSMPGTAEMLSKEIAAIAPAYADISWPALVWGEGRDGIVVAPGDFPEALSGFDTPAKGLALHLGRVLYDTGTMVTAGPSLAKLTAAPAAHLHPDDAASLGVADGDPVTVESAGASVVLPARIDESLAPRTVFVPAGFGLGFGGSVDVTVTAGGEA